MSIAVKAKNNKKRCSSPSQSQSPSSIHLSSSLPLETTPSPSSSPSPIIKHQISKDHNRRSSPNSTKHRSTSPGFSPRQASTRHRHKSPSNHPRHRSDVTLYLIIIRLTTLASIFYTNFDQYRTFKKDLG